jgi:hypothetical protein
MKTLFLDFDGVLHPYETTRSQLFCHVPTFERVIRQFPDVQIVISSDWKYIESLDALRRRFSADVAQRIVGTTPKVCELPEMRVDIRNRQRKVECLYWLHTHGGQKQPWLAVDDCPSLFNGDCPRLLFVNPNTGLDDAHAEQLAERLRQL